MNIFNYIVIFIFGYVMYYIFKTIQQINIINGFKSKTLIICPKCKTNYIYYFDIIHVHKCVRCKRKL